MGAQIEYDAIENVLTGYRLVKCIKGPVCDDIPVGHILASFED